MIEVDACVLVDVKEEFAWNIENVNSLNKHNLACHSKQSVN